MSHTAPGPSEDPILGLGSEPVPCGVQDGSSNHDRYVDESQPSDPSSVARLLDELCTELGLCLPHADRVRLSMRPTFQIGGFVDAVLLAEGLDPELADKQLYEQVRERVARLLG